MYCAPVFALSPALSRLVVYVKLQAEMDASEQRLRKRWQFYGPGDGKKLHHPGVYADLEFGERMVMRLLPERSSLDKLVDLGFLEEDVAVMAEPSHDRTGWCQSPAPRGRATAACGSSHAAARRAQRAHRGRSCWYRVPVACQTKGSNRRAGYEFANAMRHFLRHDPDIDLVGEIRDSETARAALDASSTGHLVLSTLHVGSIFGVAHVSSFLVLTKRLQKTWSPS